MRFPKFRELVSDDFAEEQYIKSGLNLGEAISYVPNTGYCTDFEKRLRTFETWEEEYARRGFRTIPIEEFIKKAYCLKTEIDELIGEKREEPILYGKMFRENEFGKDPLEDYNIKILDSGTTVATKK